MTRSEAQFDAMLRHLGAAYYQTIHGDGTASEVTSALRSAEAADGRDRGPPGNHVRPLHHGRWRVSDVMTTSVVTVPRDMPYKRVARVMTEQRVNAVPVLTRDGRVAGIVSEADVLRKEERALPGGSARGCRAETRRSGCRPGPRCTEELMTTPGDHDSPGRADRRGGAADERAPDPAAAGGGASRAS